MSDLPTRYRRYAGLAIVILVYLGGILGWSWAVTTVESASTAADSTAVHTTPPSPDALSD